MNESLPKVSIVLPTYNGAKYIRQSIDSCLNQTYKNIELIIVDDGSVDETPEIIKSYQDKRIKYLKHEKNKGLPHALNTGFANATGEYLTWTSDDNFYIKEAIREMLSFLGNKNCSFVCCNFYTFKNKDLSNLSCTELPNPITPENIGPCFLYTRKVREFVGDYDTDTVLAEDYDYWIRVLKKFPMYHLNKPLYYYRIHNESLYISKYYEVKVVDFLVRIKNNILDVEQVTSLFINLIAQKNRGISKLNRVLAKILFFKKIDIILRDFKMGKINFKTAKINLKKVVNSRLIEYFNFLIPAKILRIMKYRITPKISGARLFRNIR